MGKLLLSARNGFSGSVARVFTAIIIEVDLHYILLGTRREQLPYVTHIMSMINREFPRLEVQDANTSDL